MGAGRGVGWCGGRLDAVVWVRCGGVVDGVGGGWAKVELRVGWCGGKGFEDFGGKGFWRKIASPTASNPNVDTHLHPKCTSKAAPNPNVNSKTGLVFANPTVSQSVVQF